MSHKLKVSITVYGKDGKALKTWETERYSLLASYAWIMKTKVEVVDFYIHNHGHFIDHHIYDPAQEAINDPKVKEA